MKSLALILEKRQRFNGFNFLVCCGYCYRAHQLYVSALDCLNKKNLHTVALTLCLNAEC